MYISRYLHVSTQLLLAGADDSHRHRRPEAALVNVPRHLVVIMFQLSIRRSGWPPPYQHTVLRQFVIHIVKHVNEPGVRRQHH